MRDATMRAGALVIVFMAAGWSGAVSAQEPRSQYNAQDVINAYTSAAQVRCPAGTVAADDGVCDPVPVTRGFNLAGSPGKPGKTAKGAAPALKPTRVAGAAYKPSAPLKASVSPGDLLINFELGSANLTPQSKSNARAFAEALKSPALSPYRFSLGGHTDATGGAALNAKLSQSRAEAVKAFLVAQGVGADRLEAKGYGSERPVDAAHPKSAVNRRVEGLRLN